MSYDILDTETGLVKMWTRGVPVEEAAIKQLRNVASLPVIHKWLAVMPDVHWGNGATVGSVIPTLGAVIPAAVGVDLGCGMMAWQTSFKAHQLPDNLASLRSRIEAAVPHGRTVGKGQRDKGSWGEIPKSVERSWQQLEPAFKIICDKHPAIAKSNNVSHLGTLGTGNHFIELCLDESDNVWIMLHSGSRGVGNRIGSYFIEKAKEDMREHINNLPDKELAYMKEGSQYFDGYIEAVSWAQEFALVNRRYMMSEVISTLFDEMGPFSVHKEAVNCHHNYISKERHYGEDVFVTRKGAVSAALGELGIIPGSMGAKSYIVRGKGNPESFCSCSHGAGRAMSRNEAKRRFTVEDHANATKGVECRKDEDVVDETPMAYKDIDLVMAAQSDLVEVVHTLKQVLCVKG